MDKEHLRPDCYYLEYIFNYFQPVTFGHCQTTSLMRGKVSTATVYIHLTSHILLLETPNRMKS